MKPFSMSHFKEWLSQQDGMVEFFDISKDESAGRKAISRVSLEKLTSKAGVYQGYKAELLESFMKIGGKVVEHANGNFLIEAAGGSFYVPESCIRVL